MNGKYDQDNIFAKILRGEAPCVKVYETEHALAFMDVMPQTNGHVLVIPKEQSETIYDLSNEAALACMQAVQVVGKAVEKAMGVGGSTIFQLNGKDAGQTVPHFHFHVLPGSLMSLKGHASEMAAPELLSDIAEKIKAQIK